MLFPEVNFKDSLLELPGELFKEAPKALKRFKTDPKFQQASPAKKQSKRMGNTSEF